jgi:hypothetical protein
MLLTGSLALAASFYDNAGQPSAPSGSVQQYDYFRFRNQMMEQSQMNQQLRNDYAHRGLKPC